MKLEWPKNENKAAISATIFNHENHSHLIIKIYEKRCQWSVCLFFVFTLLRHFFLVTIASIMKLTMFPMDKSTTFYLWYNQKHLCQSVWLFHVQYYNAITYFSRWRSHWNKMHDSRGLFNSWLRICVFYFENRIRKHFHFTHKLTVILHFNWLHRYCCLYCWRTQ